MTDMDLPYTLLVLIALIEETSVSGVPPDTPSNKVTPVKEAEAVTVWLGDDT